MKSFLLPFLLAVPMLAQKAPSGFEFHTQRTAGESFWGYFQRMQSLDITFMGNGQTGIMQECHQAPGSSRGVYECYDVPGEKAYCQQLKHYGTPGKWKRYKGHNYYSDCVRPFYPND